MIGINTKELYIITIWSGLYMLLNIFVLFLFIKAGFAAIYVEAYRQTMFDYGLDYHKSKWKKEGNIDGATRGNNNFIQEAIFIKLYKEIREVLIFIRSLTSYSI